MFRGALGVPVADKAPLLAASLTYLRERLPGPGPGARAGAGQQVGEATSHRRDLAAKRREEVLAPGSWKVSWGQLQADSSDANGIGERGPGDGADGQAQG